MLLYNRWCKTFDRYVDTYIALTAFAAACFRRGGIPAHKLVVKPNFAPDILPFRPDEKEKYAVYVGRLSGEKGLWTLLEAWCDLSHLPLVVVGDGELRSSLTQYANRNSLNVTFLGGLPRKDVIDIVSRSFVQIVPSICYEGFPLVISEAYATGTPVVASRIGSLSELVIDRETGFLFEPLNARDLASKVNKIYNLHAIKEMRVSCRLMYDRMSSGKTNFQRLLRIYHDTIKAYKERRAFNLKKPA